MYQVKPQDFTRVELPQTFGFYFSAFLPDGNEVCLESCLNGFEVAIYDKSKDLIGEKVCTNLTNFIGDVAFIEAIILANKKLEDLYAL